MDCVRATSPHPRVTRSALGALAGLALALAPACGDSGSGPTSDTQSAETTSDSASSSGPTSGTTDDTTAGPMGTSDPTTGATVDATSSGSATGSSGTTVATTTGADTTTGSSGVSDTEPVTTSDTDTDTDTDTETGGQGDVDYYAFALIGALDRVVIRKADNDSGQCTELRLVFPGANPQIQIMTPEGWAPESAAVYDTLDGCLSMSPVVGAQDWAVTGAGEVSWPPLQPGEFYPCTLDIDATVMFEQAMPWAPPSSLLQTEGLAVTGC